MANRATGSRDVLRELPHALPFALARPALRSALGESQPSEGERKVVEDVVTRVRLWREVEPFYPDQTVGLPKTSESRGTESVLNASFSLAATPATGVAERRPAPSLLQHVGAAIPQR
jgi:hypothetical protein